MSRVHIVLRTANERTIKAAHAAAAAQVGAENVTRIAERPFAAALRHTFEIGVEKACDWTYGLDADVLLRPGAVDALLAEAYAAGPDIFAIEGQVADRLLGQVRYAGNHLYRTDALPEALRIGAFDANALRPERQVKEQMIAQGRRLVIANAVVGLHDHEQSYADIFRKAYVHAAKFRTELDAYARAWWHRVGAIEPDLRVASWGPPIHDAHGRAVRIDRSRFPDTIDLILALEGLIEKPPLGPVPPERIEAMIADFAPPPEYAAFRAFCDLYDRGPVGRARALILRHGLTGVPRHLAGRGLRALAARLDPPAR
ncbi:hypothetical protein [Citreimonas sp.]|uniref:hypothetical protein n=1 Tax=Citreimonas sp. TaxID=3036715 RepID=UPI004058E129